MVLFWLFKTVILRKIALFYVAVDPCNSMTLIPQLGIFKVLMDGEKLECFSDILKAIKNVDSARTSMISEI